MENLEIAVEMESSLQESATTVGYQYEIPNAGMTFRGKFLIFNQNVKLFTKEKKKEVVKLL